jgi:hypothetical protein
VRTPNLGSCPIAGFITRAVEISDSANSVSVDICVVQNITYHHYHRLSRTSSWPVPVQNLFYETYESTEISVIAQSV